MEGFNLFGLVAGASNKAFVCLFGNRMAYMAPGLQSPNEFHLCQRGKTIIGGKDSRANWQGF